MGALDVAELVLQRELRKSAPPPDALTTGIVDVHHDDGPYDLAAAKAGGIVAVISKCTEGGDWVDKGYVRLAVEAKREGLLLGLYHYLNARPGKLQAEHFLALAADHPEALLVLDHEDNAKSDFGTGSVETAVEFIRTVVEATGRHPVFYTFDHFLRGLIERASAEQRRVLGLCPLWLAKYGPAPRALPEPFAPERWALWQYSDGPGQGPSDRVRYPRGVPGWRDPVQDRSCFRGSEDDLRVWWKTAGLG